MTEPAPDPFRRYLALAAWGLGGLLCAGAVYYATRFGWIGRGLDIPAPYYLYPLWFLPAGLALLLAGNRFRSGSRASWLLVLLAVLWILSVPIFAPQRYYYFLRPVSQLGGVQPN